MTMPFILKTRPVAADVSRSLFPDPIVLPATGLINVCQAHLRLLLLLPPPPPLVLLVPPADLASPSASGSGTPLKTRSKSAQFRVSSPVCRHEQPHDPTVTCQTRKQSAEAMMAVVDGRRAGSIGSGPARGRLDLRYPEI